MNIIVTESYDASAAFVADMIAKRKDRWDFCSMPLARIV